MKQQLSIQDLCEGLEKEEMIQLVTHLSDEYADIDMAIMEGYASRKIECLSFPESGSDRHFY